MTPLPDAVLHLAEPLGWCGDIRGFLKHGSGYWHRKRRIDRWKAGRKA